MAPALPHAPREPPDYDSDDKSHRPILAAVDNIASLMENNTMGVPDQSGHAKDAPGLDMILGDLPISNNELLQVIKTLENQDTLSSGDPLSIFPLDLGETTETESVSTIEEKIKQSQIRMERRCSFLLRRLRMLQAREVGKRISEEVTQVFEKCTKGARKDGGGRPMGMKALLKRVETTAALQASAASRSVIGPTYYNAGSSRGDASKSASIGIPSGTLTGVEDTAGALRSHLTVIKHELDSDATLSSSGAESNDEAVTYNNPHQQPMPIEKRSLWNWQRDRASIASRWCWLQAQVQELEYKIRQHRDLHKQVREAKGPVQFEGEPPAPEPPVGYEGALPGSDTDDEPDTYTCARVRPLRRETFKKRKLLQMHNLHIATNKAAKPSDIRCSCEHTVESCPVCTGRADPTQPQPTITSLPPRYRLAAVDPGYHPVLSDIKDVSPATHMAALCSRGWFRARGVRRAPPPRASRRDVIPPAPPKLTPRKLHLKRGRPPLSRKIRERERDEDASASGLDRSRCRASTESRSYRRQSYDIDNIVIPQSVAANTRPQILTYKEIITPKWRVNEIPDMPMNNGVSNSIRMSIDDSDEDVSESAVSARHVRAESRERAKYVRQRRARRTDSTADSTEQLHAPTVHVPPVHDAHESIKPYSPRQFPLPDVTYQAMLSDMPEGYRAPSPPILSPPPLSPPPDDESSTLSPVSPSAYEGDDPDDLEWDPSVEKAEKRKSAFR